MENKYNVELLKFLSLKLKNARKSKINEDELVSLLESAIDSLDEDNKNIIVSSFNLDGKTENIGEAVKKSGLSFKELGARHSKIFNELDVTVSKSR